MNVAESDRDMLAFAIKADKPGRKDRFRVEHDIGCGHSGNRPAMCAMISPPTEGDYGYYFLDRGILKTDELLHRNPGAAIKITISSHARGRWVEAERKRTFLTTKRQSSEIRIRSQD